MNGSQEKLEICNWQRFCNWLNEVMGKRRKPRLLSNTVDVNWILAQGQTANRGEGFGSCSKCVYLTLYPFDTQSMMAKRCRIWISRQKMIHLAMYKAHRGYILWMVHGRIPSHVVQNWMWYFFYTKHTVHCINFAFTSPSCL